MNVFIGLNRYVVRLVGMKGVEVGSFEVCVLMILFWVDGLIDDD